MTQSSEIQRSGIELGGESNIRLILSNRIQAPVSVCIKGSDLTNLEFTLGNVFISVLPYGIRLLSRKRRGVYLRRRFCPGLQCRLQHQGIWLESPTHGAWESQACGLSSCG